MPEASSPLTALPGGLQPGSALNANASSNINLTVPATANIEAEKRLRLPEETQELINTVPVREAVGVIKSGAWVTKYRPRLFLPNVKRNVFLRVDMETLRLTWTRTASGGRGKSVLLNLMDAIVLGTESQDWKKLSPTEKQLGIELRFRRRAYRFIFGSPIQWRAWLRGIQYAQYKSQVKRRSFRPGANENKILRAQWLRADVDNSESIQFNECVALLRALQCRVDMQYLRYLFNASIQDESHVLEYDEFEHFMDMLLTHGALKDVFTRFCGTTEPVPLMNLTEFGRFIDVVQRATPKQTQRLISMIRTLKDPYYLSDTSLPRQMQGKISLYGFCRYATSQENGLFDFNKRHLSQDMSHPLHSYYIRGAMLWSKPGDEVADDSRLKYRVTTLLNKGVRALLIPIWSHGYTETKSDGPHVKYTPMVLTGSTGTAKFPFKTLLITIKASAFERNRNPVLLLLDFQFCHVKAFPKVDAILSDVLGDNLVPLSQLQSTEVFPPPTELLKKFLVLQLPTRLQRLTPGNQLSSVFDLNDPYSLERLLTEPCDRLLQLRFEDPAGGIGDGDILGNETLERLPSLQNVVAAKFANPLISDTLTQGADSKEDAIVYTASLRGLREGMSFQPPQHQPQHSLASTATSATTLTCIRPIGSLQLCGVCHPSLTLYHGINIALVPYGVDGVASLLDAAWFTQNGGCGYTAIPPSRIFPSTLANARGDSAKNETPVTLALTILAAQQLPRVAQDRFHSMGQRDTLCPYVNVSLISSNENPNTQRTPCVPGNGLNPAWKEQRMTFDILTPSIAMLLFEVRHFDASCPVLLAWNAIPVSCIATGLRWVGLKTPMLQDLPWCGLLVRASITRKANPQLSTATSLSTMPGR